MEDFPPQGEGIASQILERVRKAARVEAVYGEPREIAGRTIIPVALVGYLFAGGSGSGVNPSDDGVENVGTGVGGAGAVRVQPVGVLEVTEDETRFMPIIDWTRIIGTALTFFGLWLLFRTVFRRR
jgi:uncharacterized spore protein YtfJ